MEQSYAETEMSQTNELNPYAPPAAQVLDAETEAWSAAGVGRRLRAHVSDVVYVYFLAIPVTFLAAAAGIDVGWFGLENRRAEGELMAFAGFFMVAWVATALLYYPVMECSRWQGTFAKRRLGLRVVDLKGGQISFLHALARHAVRVAPLIPWFAYSSGTTFLLAAGTLVASIAMTSGRRDRQTLHDLLSGTRVERRP